MQKGNLYGVYTHSDIVKMRVKNILRRSVAKATECLYEQQNDKMRKCEKSSHNEEGCDCIVIFANSITQNDGVSNDVIMEAQKLRAKGNVVFVAASNCSNHTEMDVLTTTKALSILNLKHAWLLYHHSIYCKDASEVIKASKGRCIIRYHNITPEYFYKDCAAIAHICKMGLLQLERFRKVYDIPAYIATSEFTKNDLVKVGVDSENIKVCPPFISQPDEKANVHSRSLEEEFAKWEINIIFVGRVVPNKGYEHLIKLLREYRETYHEKICLHVAGGLYKNMSLYYHALDKLANRLGVIENILWWGSLKDDELDAFYRLGTVFVCASAHEGFCMPLIEAQFRSVPVVGFGTSAVFETIGSANCVVEAFDYSKMAELIHGISSDNGMRESITKAGSENCRKYLPQLVGDTLYHELSEIGLPLKDI